MNIDWHHDRAVTLPLLDADSSHADIDMVAVRAHRLARLRAQMQAYKIDACVLFDPVNIRYATGARNMQIFCARNPARYLFVALDGPVILYEFTGCEHLAMGLETIDEVRHATTASFVAAGHHIEQTELRWAEQMWRLIRQHCGSNARVGIERANAGAVLALQQ